MSDAQGALFGREVIELLVPQREPLWMVDWVTAWEAAPRPTVQAARYISPAEPVLAGHFPGMPVWPGIYTVEGLAQSCRILGTLERLNAEADRADTLAALRNLQRWLSREPSADEETALRARDALLGLGGTGLLVATDMRFTRPVFPDCRITYRATLTRSFENLVRFDVEASVSGELVSRGTLTTARPAS
jgi:3-hydroxyacyl-[acyl-carrier-protein] dehydratase